MGSRKGDFNRIRKRFGIFRLITFQEFKTDRRDFGEGEKNKNKK